MTQGTLPLNGKTLCGYCLRELEMPLDQMLNEPARYECPRCAPKLREPALDFRVFVRDAWKDRVA